MKHYDRLITLFAKLRNSLQLTMCVCVCVGGGGGGGIQRKRIGGGDYYGNLQTGSS